MKKFLSSPRLSGAVLLAVLGAAGTGNALELPSNTTPGPNADSPPFVSENNGVFQYPWGAANFIWPEQVFWENVAQLKDKGAEMRQSAQSLVARGLVPVMSSVAWGYEYKAAIGGDSELGLADKSKDGGWKEYGEWLQPRATKYFAQDWDGKIQYPNAGYVTPMMPLDPEDWPAGMDSATYGDFLGDKLGRLANTVQAQGIFAADFVVGLYGANHDFHPRVMAAFERWAGVKLVGTTVPEMSNDIKSKYWARWNDFKAHRFARFYARIAETVRSSGREPLVGGQILPQAALMRTTGNDFRIYLQYLPAKNWFFQVEVQSDEGRPVPAYWTASSQMGGHASRSPEFPLGAHMDAYQSNYWNSVFNNNKKDSAWGRKYMKHEWLSVGFTHVAHLDGTIKRAARSFQRGYWDAGGVDTPVVALVRAHKPRYPFGPAIYYSTDLERQTEATGNPNNYYWLEAKATEWRMAGIPAGFFVSDTALATMLPGSRPSSWLVYVDNLGFSALKAAEKTKLEAIAPIATTANYKSNCPLVFEGDSLGGYAFIDQNGSVIVMVSNSSEKAVTGSLKFARVENGTYAVTELLGTSTGSLTIASNAGTYPIQIDARDTKVFEIPALRELGRSGTQVSVGNKAKVLKPGLQGKSNEPRIDARGRIGQMQTHFQWSVPTP